MFPFVLEDGLEGTRVAATMVARQTPTSRTDISPHLVHLASNFARPEWASMTAKDSGNTPSHQPKHDGYHSADEPRAKHPAYAPGC
jgi:hypothetical protein